MTQSTRTHRKVSTCILSPSQICSSYTTPHTETSHTHNSHTHTSHTQKHRVQTQYKYSNRSNRVFAKLNMRFTILTAFLLPILASALVVPAATTGPDNANSAALKRQDGILGDETSDSSVCGPGINEQQCDDLGDDMPDSGY